MSKLKLSLIGIPILVAIVLFIFFKATFLTHPIYQIPDQHKKDVSEEKDPKAITQETIPNKKKEDTSSVTSPSNKQSGNDQAFELLESIKPEETLTQEDAELLDQMTITNEEQQELLPLKILSHDWQDIECLEIYYYHVRYSFAYPSSWRHLAYHVHHLQQMKKAVKKENTFYLPDIKKGLYWVYFVPKEIYPKQFKQVFKFDDHFFSQLEKGSQFTVTFKNTINGLTSLPYEIFDIESKRTGDSFTVKNMSSPLTTSTKDVSKSYLLPMNGFQKKVFIKTLPSYSSNFPFNEKNEVIIDLSKYALYTLHLNGNKAEILQILNLNEDHFINKEKHYFLDETKEGIRSFASLFLKNNYSCYFNEFTLEIILKKKPLQQSIKLEVYDQYQNNISDFVSATKISPQLEEHSTHDIDSNDSVEHFYENDLTPETESPHIITVGEFKKVEQTSHFRWSPRFSIFRQKLIEQKNDITINFNQNNLKGDKLNLKIFINNNNFKTISIPIKRGESVYKYKVDIPREYYFLIKFQNIENATGDKLLSIVYDNLPLIQKVTLEKNKNEMKLLNFSKLKRYQDTTSISLLLPGYQSVLHQKLDNIMSIPLTKSIQIFGKIVDQNNNPAANHPVRLTTEEMIFYKEPFICTTNSNGIFTYQVHSDTFSIELESYRNLSYNDFINSTKSSPTIIKENLYNSITVKNSALNPVKNAILFSYNPKELHHSNYNNFDIDYDKELLCEILYSDSNGNFTDDNKLFKFYNIFHPYEGAYLLNSYELYSSQNTEIQLKPYNKPATLLKINQPNELFKNTSFQVTIDHGLTFFANFDSFEKIDHLSNIKPMSTNEIGFYHLKKVNDNLNQLELSLPFYQLKIKFKNGTPREQIYIKLPNINYSTYQFQIKPEMEVLYGFNSIAPIKEYLKVEDIEQNLKMNFSKDYAKTIKSVSFNFYETPHLIEVDLDAPAKFIQIDNIAEQSSDNLRFYGLFNQDGVETYDQISTNSQYAKDDQSASHYFYYTHADYAGPIWIWQSGFQVYLIKEYNPTVQLAPISLIKGSEVVCHAEIKGELSLNYYHPFLPTHSSKTVKIEPGNNNFSLTDGLWSYTWNNKHHLIQVSADKSTTFELKSSTEEKLNYQIISNNKSIEFHHSQYMYTNSTDQKKENGMYQLNIDSNWNRYLYDNSSEKRIVIPLDINLIKSDFEINFDQFSFSNKGKLIYKNSNVQSISNSIYGDRFQLQYLTDNVPLYFAKDVSEDVVEVVSFNGVKDLLSQIHTRKALGTPFQIQSTSPLEITNINLILNQSYFLFIYSNNNSSQNITVGDRNPTHLFVSTNKGPIFIPNFNRQNTILTELDISKHVSFTASLHCKKGIITLYNEDIDCYLPIRFKTQIGGIGSRVNGQNHILNLSSDIKFQCPEVPYGNYHFSLYDAEEETIQHSISFTVNANTKDLELTLK